MVDYSKDKFIFAGLSKHQGNYKIRFANDQIRIKVLVRKGNTDINILELPQPMTKPECVEFLKTTDLYNNLEYRGTIDEAYRKYVGKMKF